MAILNLCQSFLEKFGMAIFGHSEFIDYTSLFGKNCQKKFGMAIFDHSKFIPVFWKNCWKKLRMAIFGHSEFISVFLGKIVAKNSEQPLLVIPNLYQSFWKKLLEKIQNGHFWLFQIYTSLSGKSCQNKFGMPLLGHSKFIPVFLGKIVRKNSEQPFLAIPNLEQSFWGKLLEKIWNGHYSPFQIYTSLFGKSC